MNLGAKPDQVCGLPFGSTLAGFNGLARHNCVAFRHSRDVGGREERGAGRKRRCAGTATASPWRKQSVCHVSSLREGKRSMCFSVPFVQSTKYVCTLLVICNSLSQVPVSSAWIGQPLPGFVVALSLSLPPSVPSFQVPSFQFPSRRFKIHRRSLLHTPVDVYFFFLPSQPAAKPIPPPAA